ncbi:MAG: hypothetical protein FJ098_09875 [Deltaproteobacteria bacterium]|nr:hypothetical protein [Deltaproteobacteria bacterium]
MRKELWSGLLVAGMLLAAAGPAHAELGRTLYGKRGVWTLGGELDLDVDWSKRYKPSKEGSFGNQTTTIDVFPELGYTFVKGFEASIGPRFTYKAGGKEDSTMYGGALSAWYHYHMIGTLFLSTGLRFSMAVGTDKDVNQETDLLEWLLGPRIGLTLSFGGKFGGFLRLAVKYDFGGQDVTTGGNTDRDWIMDLGFVSTLGMFF